MMHALLAIAIGAILTALPFWIVPLARGYWRACRIPEPED